jgi:threonine dehydrogenase-like Zn-dependent dehydrogenase
VYAVDIDDARLQLARGFGATTTNAPAVDPVPALREATGGRGVDVALELVGLPATMQQAVRALAVRGRCVIAGLADAPLQLDTYRDLLGREGEIIGANDHLLSELPLLLDFARRRALDLSEVVQRTVPLDADAVNRVLDELDAFAAPVRTAICP